MAILTLHHYDDSPKRVVDLLTPVKTYEKLSDIVDFCENYNLIDETLVIQHEPNEDYNLRLTMQEIKSVYDEGERPEDLDFF